MGDQTKLPGTEDYAPKPLPFAPSKLKGLSERLIQSHWENNYGGAVKALNVVQKRLQEALADKGQPAYVYTGLKREHLLRTGSVVLHELYFGNLGGENKPGGDIASAVKGSFGSADRWESEFRRIAQGLAGGSGWVVLGYNTHLGKLENYWAWDHMHNAPSTLPLLVMDMYEHAFHLDYGAAAAKYIDAFFQNIDWQVIERRYQSARKLG